MGIVTPIDSNKFIETTPGVFAYRPYEKEAILNYTFLRQKGKWGGPVYALNLSGAKISAHTKSKCRELGVTYIEEYDSITETFGPIGYLKKPLCATFAEENFKEDILVVVYSDISVIAISPIHSLLSTDYILAPRLGECADIFNNMSSCFLSFPKKFGFAKTWLDNSLRYYYRNKNRDIIDDTPLPLRYIEEYAASRLLISGIYPNRIRSFIRRAVKPRTSGRGYKAHLNWNFCL
jgi:hypothetical protein